MTLTVHDDHFHPPTTDELSWAETSWFAANIPEQNLVFWFYPLFRPQLGVMSCAVYAFGAGWHEPWEIEYYRPYWHLPIPDDLVGPCEFVLPNSLKYHTLRPMKRYRIQYADSDSFRADLVFDAIHEAHPLGVQGGRGHLDQLGHVTGTVVLHGREYAVDCIEMRDRTWSPRREVRQRTQLAYSYGARADGRAFHCSSKVSSDGQRVLLTGFLLDGDRVTYVVDTERKVVRDRRGRPLRIELVIADEQHNAHHVVGQVRSQMTLFTSPYVAFISAVEWKLPDGSFVYGEDQDTWSPGRLRSFLREGGYG